jgi:TctA family transporter
MIGAAVSVIGVALLAADMLWRRIGSRIAPYLWLASFALAMWSAFGGQATIQALAGIAFGAGFAVAGIDLLARSGAPEAA